MGPKSKTKGKADGTAKARRKEELEERFRALLSRDGMTQMLRQKRVRMVLGVALLLLLILLVCLAVLLPKGESSAGDSPSKKQEVSSHRGGQDPKVDPGDDDPGDDDPGDDDPGDDDPGDDVPLKGGSTKQSRELLALYRTWFKGDGTYYGSEGEGTCQISKDNLPPAARNSRYLAALNVQQFHTSAACSMCFRVKGEGKGLGSDPITGDFIVFIKDLCPVCKEGDVDLAIDGDGRWEIEIRAVQCPVGNTNFQYEFQGSNAFYLKLQVRNVRVPPEKVEVRDISGEWIEFRLTKDGHWTGSSAFSQQGNIPVRLTAITGAVVQDVIPRLVNDVVMDGKRKVQFPVSSTLPDGTQPSAAQPDN